MVQHRNGDWNIPTCTFLQQEAGKAHAKITYPNHGGGEEKNGKPVYSRILFVWLQVQKTLQAIACKVKREWSSREALPFGKTSLLPEEIHQDQIRGSLLCQQWIIGGREYLGRGGFKGVRLTEQTTDLCTDCFRDRSRATDKQE